MCFWYSLRVVAPITLISPRAKAGLSIFEASIDPSAWPAPTIVCSSSIKRMMLPSELSTSFITAFKRSSNSPRNLVPATSSPRSKERISLSFTDSGTCPSTICWAKPSAIAVFPTPASPIKTGLFLVRRDKICITRWISISRPITGSSLFSWASLVKLRVYLVKARYFFGDWASVTLLSRISLIVRRTFSLSKLTRCNSSAVGPGFSSTATKRCSTPT